MHGRSSTRPSARRAAVLAGAVAVLLAGCTGTNGGDAAQGGGGDGATTLRYLVEEPESPEQLEVLDEHLAEFEEASGIQVELESLPLESMRTVLQTQLRSGEGPDVFNWGSGPGLGGALAEAGLLYDLTDAYEERDWPIYDFARERVTFDGKVMGVPGEMETIGLYYNVDLFTELGLEEPQSLADVEAAAQAVRDAGVIPFAVSDQEGWQGGHLLSMALSSRVGSEGVDARLAGEEAWDSPDVVESLALWDRWQEAGYLPPDPTAISYDSGNALFYSGEAAMLPTGSWAVDGVEENADFEVAYVPFPAEDGSGIFTGGLGSGPFVSARASDPDAAIELLDFLVSPEHGRWTVENLRTIPAYPIETEGLDVSPLLAQVLEDTAALAEGSGDLGQNIDVLAPDTFNQAMWDGVQALLSDQADPQQVAADLQAAAQQAG